MKIVSIIYMYFIPTEKAFIIHTQDPPTPFSLFVFSYSYEMLSIAISQYS